MKHDFDRILKLDGSMNPKLELAWVHYFHWDFCEWQICVWIFQLN